MVEADCYSSSVGVLIVPMTPRLAGQGETVLLERPNQFPNGERPEAAEIKLRHTVTETRGSL